ncbi:MAG: type II toxin-antitoxin system Phd/YefM family antitoxin [Gammaproteobacteria bacterium]|nr:type II toxin-antitoxin system Phd/YefM family antitoxin [Gammaproteobacteria bacterium]
MFQILANYSTSITELKKNPTSLIERASGETIAILNRNKPSAYLVSPQFYAKLLELLDEQILESTLRKRLKEEDKAIEVSIDDL